MVYYTIDKIHSGEKGLYWNFLIKIFLYQSKNMNQREALHDSVEFDFLKNYDTETPQLKIVMEKKNLN